MFGNDFGKRKGYHRTDWVTRFKLIALLIAVILIVAALIAFLNALGDDFSPYPIILSMGMLGDPFRTTRKMKVPFKSRVGHRERSFIKFAKGILIGTLIVVFAGLVFSSLAP